MCSVIRILQVRLCCRSPLCSEVSDGDGDLTQYVLFRLGGTTGDSSKVALLRASKVRGAFKPSGQKRFNSEWRRKTIRVVVRRMSVVRNVVEVELMR